MVNVILNGNPYQCASCKEELTTGQYQRILREWVSDDPDILKRDNVNLFGILTHADCKYLTPTIENEQSIYECIAWVFTESFSYSKEIPKALQIGDQVILLPKKVGACSIGQNVLLKQMIDSCKYIEEAISYAVAVYLQPMYDSKERKWFEFWKENKQVKVEPANARELEKQISAMPAYVIYPIGFFLLSRAGQIGNGRKGIWHRIKNSLNMR